MEEVEKVRKCLWLQECRSLNLAEAALEAIKGSEECRFPKSFQITQGHGYDQDHCISMEPDTGEERRK